jgi:DNA-binding beta-propeller fold protein YncE
MKRIFTALCLCLSAAVLFGAGAARATVEWKVLKNLAVEGTPVDVSATADGQTIFVLNDAGDILIFGPDGNLRDKISTGEPADSISAAPRGDAVVLGSRDRKTVRVISLETIRVINTDNSPVRGPVNAPVTIALYTDFQ